MGRVIRPPRSDAPCSCISDSDAASPVAGPSHSNLPVTTVPATTLSSLSAESSILVPVTDGTLFITAPVIQSDIHSNLITSSTDISDTRAQLRRTILPDSSDASTVANTSETIPPWRVTPSSTNNPGLRATSTYAQPDSANTLTFGSILSNASIPTSLATSSNIRVSRLAGAATTSVSASPLVLGSSAAVSVAADLDDAEGIQLPAISSMLPPRLGTPVPELPSLASNALHITSTAATSTGNDGIEHFPDTRDSSTSNFITPASFDDTLTSIGRRALARHRPDNISARTGDTPLRLPGIRSIDLDTLERAQQAIEGSRQALEQAMQALRSVLRNSESRLERIANLIRQQVQADTLVPLAPLPRSLELEIEGDRSEYNLERSLVNLRSASIEIDRVLSSSNIHRSATATAAARLSDAVAELPPILAARRNNHTFDSLLALSSNINGAANSDTNIRQPVPRRPLRYLRPLGGHTTLGSTTTRNRNPQTDTSLRPSRSQRPNSQTSFVPQRSADLASSSENTTASLARTVYTALATEPPASDDDVPSSPHDMWDVVEHSGNTPVTRSRDIGRWTRLDANGDEVTDRVGSSRDTASLGWTWSLRPLSPTILASPEGEKSTAGESIHYLGRRDPERSRQSSFSGPTSYSGEVIGR